MDCDIDYDIEDELIKYLKEELSHRLSYRKECSESLKPFISFILEEGKTKYIYNCYII